MRSPHQIWVTKSKPLIVKTSDKSPTNVGHQGETSDKSPTSGGQQGNTSDKSPTNVGHQGKTSDKSPTNVGQQGKTSDKSPTNVRYTKKADISRYDDNNAKHGLSIHVLFSQK